MKKRLEVWKQTKQSQEGWFFILMEVIIIYFVPQSRVRQKQGQFSLCFYLPSHIPLFVHFLCLVLLRFVIFMKPSESCNTACEAASYLWVVTRQPAITTWKMKQKKMQGSLYIVSSAYHNSVLSLVYSMLYLSDSYIIYHCILTHKKCWLIDRWIFPPIVFFLFSENSRARLFLTVCLTSWKRCSRPSPVMPQEDWRARAWLRPLLLMPSWLDSFSTGSALGRSCLFAITIMGTPSFSVSFITLCSSSLASSSLSVSALSRTKKMRSVWRV